LQKDSALDIYDGCIPLPTLKIYSLRFVYYFGVEKEWKGVLNNVIVTHVLYNSYIVEYKIITNIYVTCNIVFTR